MNQPWRGQRRVIVHGKMVRGRIVVLAWLFFVAPFVLIFVLVVIDSPERLGVEGILGSLFGIAILSLFAAVPTYFWWRYRRYGNSQCRLLAPGVIGGRFEADVLCTLPPDEGEPVLLRLINYVPAGQGHKEVWRMEERISVPVKPGMRALVPVRLDIPRHPAQVLPPLRPGWLTVMLGEPHWVLEVERKTKGVDFHATFVVPVYDQPPAA